MDEVYISLLEVSVPIPAGHNSPLSNLEASGWAWAMHHECYVGSIYGMDQSGRDAFRLYFKLESPPVGKELPASMRYVEMPTFIVERMGESTMPTMEEIEDAVERLQSADDGPASPS